VYGQAKTGKKAYNRALLYTDQFQGLPAMKSRLKTLINEAIGTLQQNNALPAELETSIQIERTRDKSHGDFACNIAMMLAKVARCKPRDLAEQLVAAIPQASEVDKVEIAGPGFINFFLSNSAFHAVVPAILESGDQYGCSQLGAGKKVQVEFVSANPTGPLHVGHGRGAAYGATVADLLEAVGFAVHREYYVNDAGRQMDILAASVWLRYLELAGEELPFPVNGYKGDYVWDIAAALHRENGDRLRHGWQEISRDLPADETDGGDKELYIDAMINQAKTLLHDDQYRLVFDLGLNYILDDIRDDLANFNVNYDEWYSERSLTDSGAVMRAIERLEKSGHTYEKGGAIWFKSSDYGDEKDRVIVRDNGQTTYFASDIAYHMDKLERGFDRVIDVWGADHHGYVPRVKAALDQLRKEVGSDAARFFYVMRKCEQHMDFDIDLAKSQSSDNPVYYIQYAHARVSSVFRQLQEKGVSYDQAEGLANLDRLTEQHEVDLFNNLNRYGEVLENAALNHEPHQLAHYLRELANDFHTYYNAHQFIVDDSALRNARLTLTMATQQVIANGLGLLGVSAPDTM
jgi:arginyl-tRNA synthetase